MDHIICTSVLFLFIGVQNAAYCEEESRHRLVCAIGNSLKTLENKFELEIQTLRQELATEKADRHALNVRLENKFNNEIQALREELAAERAKRDVLNSHFLELQKIISNFHNSSVHQDENNFTGCISSLPESKITNWGELVSNPTREIQISIGRSLLDYGCSANLTTVLEQNSNEMVWPSGLNQLEIRRNNRGQYASFITREIPNLPNKQAVVAMATENQHMPSNMILEPGIVFVFSSGVISGAVCLLSLQTANVTDWGLLISTPSSTFTSEMKSSLQENGCPEHLLNVLMQQSHESYWPSGLSTLDIRTQNRKQYGAFITRNIPNLTNKQAVVALAIENQHMPSNMMLEPGIVFVFRSGVIVGEELEVCLSSLHSARVTDWGELISTPSTSLKSQVKRSLTQNGCQEQLANVLMQNSHESFWPSGLRTFSIRIQNRAKYADFITRRIPNLSMYQAVVVIASENKHMPQDMIKEPGLVFTFVRGVV